MIINKLKLTNYRNLDNQEIEFNPHINILVGDNGQGKTNVVEALSYLSLLKSFRGSENKSLIKDGEEYATIEAISNDKKIRCYIGKNKRQCFINEIKIKKLTDFIGNINVVVFSPDNVSLFKDSPSIRREFIDDELSKLFSSYFISINEYKELKKQRNEALKIVSNNKALLETLSLQLSQYCYEIICKRKEYVDRLNKEITNIYQKLSNTSSNLSIVYKSDFLDLDAKEIYQRYVDSLDEDILRQQTLLGVHKDDLELYLDNKEISEFGSQGQNRLAVVALKLASLSIIKEFTKEDGIVILDDVLSELDEDKQERLLNNLVIDNQIFITSAHQIKINNSNINIYVVNKGNIRRK